MLYCNHETDLENIVSNIDTPKIVCKRCNQEVYFRDLVSLNIFTKKLKIFDSYKYCLGSEVNYFERNVLPIPPKLDEIYKNISKNI